MDCQHNNWSFVIDGAVTYYQCDDCLGFSKLAPVIYEGRLRLLLPLNYRDDMAKKVTFLQRIGRRSKCCNLAFVWILGRNYKGYEDFTGCSGCHSPKRVIPSEQTRTLANGHER